MRKKKINGFSGTYGRKRKALLMKYNISRNKSFKSFKIKYFITFLIVWIPPKHTSYRPRIKFCSVVWRSRGKTQATKTSKIRILRLALEQNLIMCLKMQNSRGKFVDKISYCKRTISPIGNGQM